MDGIDWSEVRLPGLGADTVALVTGGTGAIGRHAASALLALGCKVAIMGRSSDRVRAVVDELSATDSVIGVPGDVSRQEDCAHVVDQVVSMWGRLDVVIHAAAIGDSGSDLDDLSSSEIDRVLAVNVRGTLLIAQAAAAPMRRQGHGSIVTLASVAANRVSPGGLVYGASKAATVRLTNQLAIELGPSGVRVNTVSPGQTPTVLRGVNDRPGAKPVTTGPRKAGSIPLRRRGALDDYVGAILFLASDLAGYVTATDLLVDGGIAVRR